jgi:hypothetical protein
VQHANGLERFRAAARKHRDRRRSDRKEHLVALHDDSRAGVMPFDEVAAHNLGDDRD